MRKFLFFICAIAGTVVACQKEASSVQQPADGREIVFNLAGDGIDFDVRTRATEVTSVSDVYWEAKSSSGVVYPVSSYAVSSGKVSTGKYWPSEGASYDYKVSNVAFTTSTGAIAATNATDIVAGTATSVTGNSCSVTLDHIFARTATLTMNTQSGYTISDVSWKIKSKGADSGTAGTYTIGTGWGSTATTALSEQAITSSSDLYLIPATYTLTVTYTLTMGDYSQTFTKSADVTLVQGKKNSITGTATGGSASEILFDVSVAAWGTNTITPTFS